MAPPALYIALYPYKPQKADELELRKGALYTVSEKCQDGWFKGSSVRTQKIGKMNSCFFLKKNET